MARIGPIDEVALAEVAAFVAALQAQPAHHIGGYASDAPSLEQQMRETEPAGVAGIVVARDEDGALLGVLQAEWDTDPPRVWWQGPVVRDGDDWMALADALYEAGRALLPDVVTQQELAPDARNERVAAFARRHGFVDEVASAVLTRPLASPPSAPALDGSSVRSFAEGDRHELASLHDRLFPSTHRPGARLDEGADRIVLVADDGGSLLGYVAAELQEDGDGYLDFLGVAEVGRRRGIARALVAVACERLRDAGSAHVHLTVREDNEAARALYASLGFVEERILVPWRLGFSVDLRASPA